MPYVRSKSDPISWIFIAALTLAAAGCAASAVDPLADDDGDGLDNATEAAGWTVVVQGAAGAETRHVASRIDLIDTDGDGLDDAEERSRRLDPTAADTDGDGLDDGFEVHELGSRADAIDSDGDAAGDPRLWDRGEVEDIGSSPALADTDGDGFDDRYEIVELRTDPRIADLPRLELSLQSVPEIGLNTVLSTGEEQVVAVSESVTRSISMTHGESRTTSESFSLMVGFGLEAGWSGGIHVVASFNTEMTTSREVSLTLSEEYTEAASAQVGETRQRAESRDLTFEGGYVAFPVRIANAGPVAFTLQNAAMTLLHRDRRNPWVRRALAHIEPADSRSAFPPRTLGPGEAHENVYFRRDGLGWDDAIALMQDPRGLEVEVSGYELVDADGRAFAHDATLRRSRTATLVIDHGPTWAGGGDGRWQLATNLRLDPATGRSVGLSVGTALAEWLGRSAEVVRVAGPDGEVAVLMALDGHRAAGSALLGGVSRWNVVRVRDGIAEVVTDDFDTLRLMPGEALHLIYDEDLDGDGLGVRTELRLGTSDEAADSDGDGLTDGEEVLVGWSPDDARPTHAISDPTRADTDGDGLDDAAEVAAGTDAFDPDSDDDGLRDGVDQAPLDVDHFLLEDFAVVPVDDGAAVEVSWAPIDNPAIEAIYLLRAPVDALGRMVPVPADTMGSTPDEIAVLLGADVIAELSPAETRYTDAPSADASTWRYVAFVRYAGVGLLPAAARLLDHERALRYDRVRVRLLRLEGIGDDDCTVYWDVAVAPGDGFADLTRRTFRLSPQAAIEIEEDTVVDIDAMQLAPDEREVDVVLPRDGTGLTVVAEMWAEAGRGRQARLGAQVVSFDPGEAAAGGEHTLVFDQIDDPGECVIRVVYDVAVVEQGVIDPGMAGLQ